MISEEVLEQLLKRVEETAKEVVELRKTVEQIVMLLCVLHGKIGETDIGRVIAKKIEERRVVEKIKDKFFPRKRGVCGLEGEAVDQVERVDPGAERVGGER